MQSLRLLPKLNRAKFSSATAIQVSLVLAAVGLILLETWLAMTVLRQRPLTQLPGKNSSNSVAPFAKHHSSVHERPLGHFQFALFPDSLEEPVSFDMHLVALLHESQVDEFEKRRQLQPARIREQLFQVLRTSELTDLKTPGVPAVKRRVRQQMNQLLGDPLVQEISIPEYHYQ